MPVKNTLTETHLERHEEKDETTMPGKSFVAVINLEEGQDSSQPTFSAEGYASGTLQALQAQETSFIFKMCNPDKKKRQTDVWGLLFSTSYSYCLFRSAVRGLFSALREQSVSVAVSLSHGSWEPAAGVLGCRWCTGNSSSLLVTGLLSTPGPAALPTQPQFPEDAEPGLHFHFRPIIAEFGQLNRRFRPAGAQQQQQQQKKLLSWSHLCWRSPFQPLGAGPTRPAGRHLRGPGRAGPAGLARGSPGRRGRARLGRRSPGGRQRAPRVPQSGAGRSLRRGREGRGCHVLGAERRAGSAARASAPRVAAERGSWRRPALRTLPLSCRCPALPVPRENATPSKGARRPRSRPLVPGEAGGCGRRREGAAGSAGTEHGASPRCPGGAAGQRDRLPGGTTSCGLGLRALRPGAGAPRMSPESLGRRRAGAEPGAGRDRRQAGGREGGTEPPPGHAAGAGWQLPGSAAEKLTRKITAPKTRRRLSGSVCCCFFLFHVLNFGSQSQVQLCRETTETCV